MEYRPLARHEVVKHIGAIHISNTLSLLERKISNVLLRNAWDFLTEKEVHTISVRELADAAGFESKDIELIKRSLTSLVKASVTWNILGRDKKNVWGISSILGSVQISEGSGICEYTYPAHLRQLLKNPNIFARLNLLIQRQFDSKYALALWEYASGEVSLSGDESMKERCLTEWITVETLHRLLGSENPAYAEYKIFNRDVLKPAISEVNRVSNLDIIETETQREKRKIIALRFAILPKESYQLPLDLEIPRLLDSEVVQPIPVEVNEEKAVLVRRMMDAGVDEKGARGVSRSYGVDRITENLDWALAQIESGRNIKRPGAFIVSAIRNDYIAPERVKRKKVQQTRMDNQKAERDKKELEALVAKVQGDFWLHRVAKVDAAISAFSDDEKAVYERRMEEGNAFHTVKFWEEYRRSGLESRPIRALFYSFAFRELLDDEDCDLIGYAQSQGVATDVLTALNQKLIRPS